MRDVLLVQAQILVNEEHFRHGTHHSLESCVKILTPFWVFSGGNPLRRQYNLQIPLDVLIVSFERVIHVEALDPGSIDLDLVDIIRRVIIFFFILILLLFLLILLAHIVCILARGARIILLLLVFFLNIHGSLIHLPN